MKRRNDGAFEAKGGVRTYLSQKLRFVTGGENEGREYFNSGIRPVHELWPQSCRVSADMPFARPLHVFSGFILALGLVLVPGSARGEERESAPDYQHRSTYCTSCERDPHGRIKRSTSVRRQFQREHPCPSTGLQTGPCPGYIKDHVVPLKHGGTDSVDNMQWEPGTEAKAKDRVE